jgi:hypothetical protein
MFSSFFFPAVLLSLLPVLVTIRHAAVHTGHLARLPVIAVHRNHGSSLPQGAGNCLPNFGFIVENGNLSLQSYKNLSIIFKG